MRSLDIHEDDEGLIFLGLRDNYVTYPGHTWEIGDAPVYSPGDEQYAFEALGISAEAVEREVSKHFQPYDNVTTGYSTHRVPLQNTKAFGNASDGVVFVAHNAAGLLTGIWFIINSEKDKDRLIALLAKLSNLGKFIFEDSSWPFQCKPDEPELLKRYFADRFE